MNKSQLRTDIEMAINRNNAESGSDTPDFILAEYLMTCLEAFDKTLHARSAWYNHHCRIGSCDHHETKVTEPPVELMVEEAADSPSFSLFTCKVCGKKFSEYGCREYICHAPPKYMGNNDPKEDCKVNIKVTLLKDLPYCKAGTELLYYNKEGCYIARHMSADIDSMLCCWEYKFTLYTCEHTPEWFKVEEDLLSNKNAKPLYQEPRPPKPTVAELESILNGPARKIKVQENGSLITEPLVGQLKKFCKTCKFNTEQKQTACTILEPDGTHCFNWQPLKGIQAEDG